MTTQPARELSREQVRRMFATPDDAGSGVDKTMPLEAALRAHVRPGMTLHMAYSEGRPIATGHALVRCFAGTHPGFTLVGAGLVGCQAALVTERLVRKLLVSFVGENYPTPAPNRILQQAIDRGEVEIENQSLLVLYQRLAAGAAGLPFALTRSWAGSSLERNPSYRRIADPFSAGGDGVGAVSALVPDITFVHALAGDREGNLLLSPPFGEAEAGAFAASTGVIATVERIVPPEVIRRNATLARIPSHRVLSVSELPLGCHPYAIYNPGGPGLDVPDYVEDYDSFAEIRRACESIESFRDWTRAWILELPDHEAYLRKLGAQRIGALRGRARDEAWWEDLQPHIERIAAVQGHDPVEAMVTAAADVLERKVRSGLHIVEAGVGYANLAAWLAVTRLRQDAAIPAELVAEIGIYGQLPRPGEPFIFSNRNLPTSKSFTGVESILGLHVGGRHNACVAIIGAGQIDPAGNINSTYGNDGRFLVGSGGANDIASAARDVVAVTQQSRLRLVEKLAYVTSPGLNLSTLVTDVGVYAKRDGRLVLTHYHPAEGQEAAERVELARSRCGWPLAVADDLQPTATPARRPAAVAAVRSPQRVPAAAVRQTARPNVERKRSMPDIEKVPATQDIVFRGDNGRIILMDSITFADERNNSADVLVGASFCGMLSIRWPIRVHPKGVICHEAGPGRDAAGVSGLWALEAVGIAAAAAATHSCRIADGHDMYENGVLSHANDTARRLGVVPGMAVREAARRMVEWVRPLPEVWKPVEEVHRSARGRVMAMGSVTFITDEHQGDVICAGSHFGHTSAAYSSRFRLRGVICNDAGRCRDDSGISGLAVLQDKGIPGAAVSTESARIGEGTSTYADGIVSALNEAARRLGIHEGMAAREAAARMLERDEF